MAEPDEPPTSAGSPGASLRGQLAALLARLDWLEASGRPLDADEGRLLASLGARLAVHSKQQQETSSRAALERAPMELAGDARSQRQSAALEARPSHRQQDGDNPMRYSTPNLLLTSNFELILRQRELVSVLPRLPHFGPTSFWGSLLLGPIWAKSLPAPPKEAWWSQENRKRPFSGRLTSSWGHIRRE